MGQTTPLQEGGGRERKRKAIEKLGI